MSKEELLALYISFMSRGYIRNYSMRPLVSQYNKANPHNKLTIEDVLQYLFPKFYQYLINLDVDFNLKVNKSNLWRNPENHVFVSNNGDKLDFSQYLRDQKQTVVRNIHNNKVYSVTYNPSAWYSYNLQNINDPSIQFAADRLVVLSGVFIEC